MNRKPLQKTTKPILIWLFPLAALLLALYLAYSHYNSIGPTIEIEFKDASGIEANRTKIRYRSLDIGTVTDIRLNDDFQNIIVSAQITANAAPLLKEDSQFWIVRPQVSAAGVTGLNTLISGSFITLNPGNADETSHHFIGLEKPSPLDDTQGLRLRLISENSNGLHDGSPIYYKGRKVGIIEQIEFDDQLNHLNLNAFIYKPYEKLINKHTKFWNISGIDVSLNSAGINIDMESLETLALGGITFSSPSLLSEHTPLEANTTFTLYKNEQAIYQSPFAEKEYYVSYFPETVNGLDVGSIVDLNGIGIGKVLDVRLIYDQEKNQILSPVIFEIEPERIEQIENNQALITHLIENGLNARLENGNLVTGSKIIRLSLSDNKQKIEHDPYTKYPIIPSTKNTTNQILDNLNAITASLRALPLDEIGNNLNQSLIALERTLNSLNNNSAQIDKILKETQPQLQELLKNAQSALYGLNPDSNLYFQLNDTLNTIERSARSFDQLMQQLNAKPNSLVFGE